MRPPFGCLKFLATRGFKNSAALLYDIRYILRAEVDDIVGNQTTVTAIDAFDFKSAENSRAGDGADSGIHARSITAGCKDAYTFDFCHNTFVYTDIVLGSDCKVTQKFPRLRLQQASKIN